MAREKLKVVCVFCSADDKVPDEYKKLAYDLGRQLAANNFALLSGGNNSGLMNHINDGHSDEAPQMARYAVIPEMMRTLAVHHPRIPINNVMWSEDVYDRLKTFHGMCDFLVILPGGFGTLHEMMDCLVLSQFGIIKKHIFLFNVDNFWDPMLKQFAVMVEKHTLYHKHLEHIIVINTIPELIKAMQSDAELELTQGFADEYWKDNK